ncbi:hypothetical protein [Aquabacter sediminis]|uniref:hypothetical protein n=1 Tax=Aquabacter sediminis TaxID=3029197 RepID=UPI00237E8AB3|nr:hypothetical protein [Aquabacter sp. P-9]MDE1569455.1 hypothetical protein [Aquabacter sp. P-9]
MQHDTAPAAKAPIEVQNDPQVEAEALTDAAAEAAAGGMCFNDRAFLKWARTHDEKGNELDPQTGEIIKASGR